MIDLYEQVIKLKDESNILYKSYIDTKSKKFEDEVDEFNTYIRDIKELEELPLDFTTLSEMANLFTQMVNDENIKVKRNDIILFTEELKEKLGVRIEALCHDKPIITQSTNFPECPFKNKLVVYYGHETYSQNYVKYDGNTYGLLDSKVESNDYYRIYCFEIDE